MGEKFDCSKKELRPGYTEKNFVMKYRKNFVGKNRTEKKIV